ncbi:MAG: flippase activity-associated protein Agl23 [Haloferacaceae archaeon]
MPSRPGPSRGDRVLAAVVGLAALALVARLLWLGRRPFHWDEARVGYWTLRFLATGSYEYRPVAGGPFLYLVGRPTLALFGATDATARLPVALVGGLLPLVALLFRGRLDGAETVLLAAFLGFNPLLLYYSRFLRGDVPAAAFGLVAVGAVVRLADGGADGDGTGDRRFAYLAGAAVALALAASGFAVAYPFAWLAAGLLVLDHDRLLGRPARAASRVAALRDRLLAGWRTALGAVAAGALTLFLCYAPRSGGQGPGLWRPTTLPATLEAAVLGSARKFVGVRILGRRSGGTHQLLPYLADNAEALAAGAVPLVALALYALFRDRYGPGDPRPLVAFAGYWGLVGLVLFPAVAEVSGPWVAVHSAVPLAVPAAVGGGAVVRFGTRAFAAGRTRGAAAAALVVVAAVAGTGAVVASDVYGPSTPDNGLASYAQPADDLGPFHADVTAVAPANEGTDVLYYGDDFRSTLGADTATPPVPEEWGKRLPLPWYTERAGATTDAASTPRALDDPPPVVVADASRRADLASRLDGYEAREYRLALWNRRVVVFVRR